MTTTYRIHDLVELLDAVSKIQRSLIIDGRTEYLWFRGQPNAEWKLIPSIQRCGLSCEEERYITNDFRIKANQIMDNPPDRRNYAAWMSIMQHYGIPTRMLDWSRSPLIAAFFAVQSHPTEDACIWALRPGALNHLEAGEDCIYGSDMRTIDSLLQTAFAS